MADFPNEVYTRSPSRGYTHGQHGRNGEGGFEMKVISKTAIVFAFGIVMSAALSSVHAICSVAGVTFTSNYFDAPVGQDPAATVGVFWGKGQYDPSSGVGTDNGTAPSSTWVRGVRGVGFYLAGEWASDPFYDGCIQDAPNPQPATMAAAWTTSDGATSYFVALCAVEDVAGTFNSLTDIPGFRMTQIPKPVIHSSGSVGTTTTVTAGHAPLPGGVYNTRGCTLGVTGFKIYTQTVPRNAPAPGGTVSRRPSSGWTLLGTASQASGDVTGQVECAVSSDIYLMMTLVLDGNVELLQGSSNSARVECGPNGLTATGHAAVTAILRGDVFE